MPDKVVRFTPQKTSPRIANTLTRPSEPVHFLAARRDLTRSLLLDALGLTSCTLVLFSDALGTDLNPDQKLRLESYRQLLIETNPLPPHELRVYLDDAPSAAKQPPRSKLFADTIAALFAWATVEAKPRCKGSRWPDLPIYRGRLPCPLPYPFPRLLILGSEISNSVHRRILGDLRFGGLTNKVTFPDGTWCAELPITLLAKPPRPDLIVRDGSTLPFLEKHVEFPRGYDVPGSGTEYPAERAFRDRSPFVICPVGDILITRLQLTYRVENDPKPVTNSLVIINGIHGPGASAARQLFSDWQTSLLKTAERKIIHELLHAAENLSSWQAVIRGDHFDPASQTFGHFSLRALLPVSPALTRHGVRQGLIIC